MTTDELFNKILEKYPHFKRDNRFPGSNYYDYILNGRQLPHTYLSYVPNIYLNWHDTKSIPVSLISVEQFDDLIRPHLLPTTNPELY